MRDKSDTLARSNAVSPKRANSLYVERICV